VHRRLPFSGFQDQPRLLGNLLGMRILFQNNWRYGPGGFGNAILTSLPFSSRVAFPLPNGWERRRRPLLRTERRGALLVVTENLAGPVSVLTTHWSLEKEDRIESAVIIAGQVIKGGLPAIVCGDFNADAGSAEIESLMRLTGLVDAGCGGAIPTFPADNPQRRIDYVFCSPALTVRGVRAVETRASDHLPVVLEWGRVFDVK
jgi:endonuclease/exonuclease/phosphatase family metal-dependent hydrolase